MKFNASDDDAATLPVALTLDSTVPRVTVDVVVDDRADDACGPIDDDTAGDEPTGDHDERRS